MLQSVLRELISRLKILLHVLLIFIICMPGFNVGIGSGSGTLEQCIAMASSRVHLQQWKNCQHLIIDEISMTDSELFDKIEAVARAVRKNDRPFGGIQLIVCGDFLQLPPVIKRGETKKFCFQVRRNLFPHYLL